MTEPFVCPLCWWRESPLTPATRVAGGGGEGGPRLVRCPGCGLIRLHPQPDDAALAAAYGGDYAPHVRSGLSGKAKGWLERRSVRLLRRYLAPPRRVLDIGCATGELLLAIRETGNPNVMGIEPGVRAACIARSHGLEVTVGFLEDAYLPEENVDTVVMSHSLEHVRDPIATLRESCRVLRPGGALILWLPNVESIEARALGRRWIGYDPPRHLTTFGVSTLTRALETTGFRVADIRHEAVGLEWAWGLRLAAAERAPALAHALARIHPLLIVAATPLAAIGALTRRSGRIRVIAVKPFA